MEGTFSVEQGSGLLDHRGRPVTSSYKKASPPRLGEAFSPNFGLHGHSYHHMPGVGAFQMDLDKLTLADFRMMRDHYQVNASLSVLTFMIHQLDWKIECGNAKIRDHVQANVAGIWTRLVRAISQAFWAGYSPNILQWENDMANKTIQLTKIKDLLPEGAAVNWKMVDGWAPNNHVRPKIPVYDGIQRLGESYPIPVENTFWYPLLMENSNWYGRKLLRPAFTPWFFSVLIHLFNNRYMERFAEPTPVGRAPYDDEIDIDGKKVPGRDVMLGLLNNLRSRGAIVLPSEKQQNGNDVDFEYQIEYLESQMRGADFERYLMRLDEEISLGLFTPLLMLRTADVGSYNLGTQHSHVYMQMLNALAGDMKEYIDKYILSKMVDYNFSQSSPRATIHFRQLGDDRIEMIATLLQQLFAGGRVMPDLKQLGEIAGLSLKEVEEVTKPGETPEADPNAKPEPGKDPAGKGSGESGGSGASQASRNSREVATLIFNRLEPQVRNAFAAGTVGNGFIPSPGYQRQYEAALQAEGVTAQEASDRYAVLAASVQDMVGVCGSADEALPYIRRVVGDAEPA